MIKLIDNSYTWGKEHKHRCIGNSTRMEYYLACYNREKLILDLIEVLDAVCISYTPSWYNLRIRTRWMK